MTRIRESLVRSIAIIQRAHGNRPRLSPHSRGSCVDKVHDASTKSDASSLRGSEEELSSDSDVAQDACARLTSASKQNATPQLNGPERIRERRRKRVIRTILYFILVWLLVLLWRTVTTWWRRRVQKERWAAFYRSKGAQIASRFVDTFEPAFEMAQHSIANL
eukprot:Selendium_serpulae@DN5603_c0_g1_i2.p2